MDSSPDRASTQSRRHCVTIHKKSRRISVLKAKKKAQTDGLKPYAISKSTDSVLDFAGVKALILLISKYIARLLADSTRRRAIRLKCKSRIRMCKHGEFFEFGEQVVLANLYWGMQSLEKAINSTSVEAKNARLENAERMLQVPALLDEDATTAGMSNSYIICCAYFHLALVWKIRKNERQMALHLLQAFVVSPHYSRLDFAPGLWKEIFLPHVSFLENEFVADLEMAGGIEPDELHLKRTQRRTYYKEALNKITRKHAKYYKDWLTYYTVVYSGDEAGDSLWMDEQIRKPKLIHEEHRAMQKKTARKQGTTQNRVHIREGLYDGENLKQESLESFEECAKINDTSERIHVRMACLSDLSAEESIMSNEKDVNGKLCFIYNEKEEGGSTSPLLQVEDCRVSTRKSGRFCYLMNKETTDPKSLSEMLREPQSDMSIFADSHSNSGEEENDSEEKTEKRPTSEAAACLSFRNMPKTEPLESTGLDFHFEGKSYKKSNQGENYGQTYPTLYTNNICSPLNQQFPDSIIKATREACKKTSVLQDQSCCQNINTFDLAQPTIAHVTRQLLDQYKSETLDSLQQIKLSLPIFSEQLACDEKTLSCISDRCFDDHLSESLRCSDIGKVKQLSNSARRKLDFPDNVSVCKSGNSDDHNKCQAFEKEIEFEQAVCILCTSDEIKECEEAVLTIKYLWADLENKTEAESALLRAAVVDQLMEILLASRVEDVLRAAICILSVLVIREKFIVHYILKNDPELCFVTDILKRMKIYEAAILLYLLEPSAIQMKTLELLPILVEVIYNGNHYVNGPISLPWMPSAVAVMMIEILVASFDYLTNDSHLQVIISLNILPGLLDILKSENMEVRVAAAFVLTQCMRSDGTCRHYISQRTPMASIVQLLHTANRRCRSVALEFIAEVICLQRNSFMVGILRQIQQQGVFSSMHILMAYIQQIPLEYQPLPAGLILQLDMLADSQGQSLFREEAVEVLLAALSCKESISAQISSAAVLSSLAGRFTYIGEPSTVAWLVKKAGLSWAKQKYISGDLDCLDHGMQEEDTDAVCWSNKIAKKIMLSGTPVFEALKKGLKSNVSEIARDCLITVAWLGYELSTMQRNRLRPIARDIILPEIVTFMQPGIELEERVLASLSLYNYTAGSGMQQLLKFSRELHGPLRRLAAFTWTAEELSKVIAYSSPSKFNTAWDHKHIIEIGNNTNGATLALIHYKGKLYSGHSDGSIKAWEVKGMSYQLVQELREHRKSVTCFAVFEPSKYLISGSADKTVRIWNGLQQLLECVMVVNMKDPICKVDTHGQMLFAVTRSSGVKVHHGERVIKVLNENKHVQSLVIAEDKIYCGCKDSSIQVSLATLPVSPKNEGSKKLSFVFGCHGPDMLPADFEKSLVCFFSSLSLNLNLTIWGLQAIDVASGQAKQIQGCTRTWLGNKPVYTIVPFRDWIYTGGALVDGFNLKVRIIA
ncbi:hypothetical protein KI387_015499 [Taxus chinensis]|uniref:E3 ubiquitin-protein ligase LIN-1 n=1 Tax=Taxus chinensis TaxID=29808 RepID=A0AA38GFB3_TAXCH|nr:hypothetical protein KI387_015499 [Taxus chinensis]